MGKTMDIGTGIVLGTSILTGGGIILKLFTVKISNNKINTATEIYVRKEVCNAVHSSLKESVENGFFETSRRLGLIEGELRGRNQ